VTWSLSVNTQTDIDAIRTIRRLVRDLVEREGAAAGEAGEIEVVMGEALSNAAVHAYPDAIGPVSVGITFDGETFTFAVQDRGETGSAPTVPRELPRTGKGLFVISRLVDHVAVHLGTERWAQGATITMIRRLHQARTTATAR
jgi:anti-sigma regulatory factor (Ser/Thr protein kinase)